MKVSKGIIFLQLIMVYWIHKIFYGLKQSSLEWFKIINIFLIIFGFINLTMDGNIYHLKYVSKFTIFTLYMDNIFIKSNNIIFFNKIKIKFYTCFLFLDLGEIHQFLSLKIICNPIKDWFYTFQWLYLIKKLQEFRFVRSKPMTTLFASSIKLFYTDYFFIKDDYRKANFFSYINIIRSFNWSKICTQYNFSYVTSLLINLLLTSLLN